MNWDNESVTIKGERLVLTERGKVFFRTVTFIKNAFIMLAGISLLWLFAVFMAVLN